MSDINFYNEASAAKLGWTPEWFGCDAFDEELQQAIREFQSQNGTTADGMCGPATYRRKYTTRAQDISEVHVTPPGKDYIIHCGNAISIDWPRVVQWTDIHGLRANHYAVRQNQLRPFNMFVNHWDVTLSAKHCQRILDKRGISVHFLIDNDGTIYQTMDTRDVAWHAGSKKLNECSIGVEISCAYDLKYQSWYVKNGFGERPIIEDAYVHGRKLDPFLGFYPVQLQALRALWGAIHRATGIPLQCPSFHGSTSTHVEDSARNGNFRGFVSHYHLTERKIDCAGLDIDHQLKLLGES